jgi:hypothetical protein
MRIRITILALSIGVIAWNILAPKLMTAATTNPYALQVSEPDQLDLYIERLAFAESSGREDITIVDTNGLKSYGCLMFQQATWTRYAGRQADIMDCPLQKRIARKILLEHNGWKNWRNSARKIGLPPVRGNG